VVEQQTCNPKTVGLNPVTGSGIEKLVNKVCLGWSENPVSFGYFHLFSLTYSQKLNFECKML
jgi:hypothetical protein